MEKVNRKLNKNFFYFLLGLALIRPSLDILSQIEFQIYSNLPTINLNVIIGGLVFLILIFFFFINVKKIYSTPLFYPIFIFIGLCFLSIFYSIDTFTSIREFIRIATIFLLYFLAYKLIEDKKDFYLLLKIILISYIIPAIVGLIQFFNNSGMTDDFGGFQRIYGTFAHPNLFAFYTFFILGLLISLLLTSQKTSSLIFNKKIIIIAIGLSVFLLFATYTRSALACLSFFVLIFGILKYRRMLLVGALLFLAAYFLSDVFRERLWELISLDPYGSIVWRFKLWKDILPLSLWQPWFGYGLGTFEKLTEFYRGFKLGSLNAHNDYLKIFVENGIIGLISYFWIIIGLLLYLLKIFKKTIKKEKIIGLGLLVITISLIVAASFDNILRTTALQWNLWIIFGGWIKIKAPHIV